MSFVAGAATAEASLLEVADRLGLEGDERESWLENARDYRAEAAAGRKLREGRSEEEKEAERERWHAEAVAKRGPGTVFVPLPPEPPGIRSVPRARESRAPASRARRSTSSAQRDGPSGSDEPPPKRRPIDLRRLDVASVRRGRMFSDARRRRRQHESAAAHLDSAHQRAAEEAHTRPARAPEREGSMNAGADTLNATRELLRAYVVMTDAQADAIAVWALHTHALDAAEASPYLAVTSPERRSGKTRLLEVLELLAARPWRVIRPSEAVLYRKLAAGQPTLLLDEVDAIYHAKANENAQALRAVLDAGNRRGVSVPRCVGPQQELKDFGVFSAKALGGIGQLPDTIADRAIPIRLKRRTEAEPIRRFRQREADEAALPLHEALRSWAEHQVARLAEARPKLPDELNDRAMDGWEPLIAIADLAGGEWPERARDAARILSADERADEDESLGVQLLEDIRAVYDDHDGEQLTTAELLEGLAKLDERPWREWWWDTGEPSKGAPRRLAGKLRPYGVHSEDVWTGSRSLKGYRRDAFEDAWKRYAPPPSDPNPRDPREPASVKGSRALSNPREESILADSKQGANPHEQTALADLADSRAENGGVGRFCEGCDTPERCAAHLSCHLIARLPSTPEENEQAVLAEGVLVPGDQGQVAEPDPAEIERLAELSRRAQREGP